MGFLFGVTATHAIGFGDCHGRAGIRVAVDVKNQVQLITYVDRLAGNFKLLKSLLTSSLAGLFGGAHLLPFFAAIDGADAGFDPTDHTQVDSRLGNWGDVLDLSEHVEIAADLIVNHISSASPQFQNFWRNGANSSFAGMFQ